MKKNLQKLLTIVLVLVISWNKGYSQPVTAGDCNQAVNICTNASFSIDPNGFGNINEFGVGTTTNPSTNPASGNYGCLLAGELNSTWMIINIATSGTLEFSFGQPNQNYNCYDWIMWPYNSNTCSAIFNNTLPPIRCNWNGACGGFTGIASTIPAGGDASNFEPALNVTCGQQYIICFSNYSSAVTNVPLNFFGTAQVSCTTFTPITVNNATICPGGQATLTANGGTSYTWSTGATTSSITVNPSNTTSYTVTGTGPCGTGTATATVTVLPAGDPSCSCTVNASNTGPYCAGQTITLNASNVTGAVSYTWTGPNGFTSNLQNPTIANASTLASGTYTVTVSTGSQTCTASTTVTVNPVPTVNITPASPVICAGQSSTLTATGGGTYAWNTGATTAGITVSPGVTTTYTVTVTGAGGCTATMTRTVTVNPLPAASITPPTPICVGQSATLTANGGGTYLWSTGATTQNITVSPASNTTYTVTVTSAAGCTATASATQVVNPLPVVGITPAAPTICEGQSSTLTATGGGTYSWSTGATTAAITVSPATTTTYTVTVTSAAGCSATLTRTVTVNPVPTPSINPTSPICAGQSATLTANGGGTYAWNTGATTAAITVSPGTTTSYTVTVTSAAGCTATTSATQVVNPLPTPSINPTTPICAGQSATLTANGGGTYLWNTGATTAAITVLPASTTSYTVTVTSAAGCSATTSATQVVNPLPTPSINPTTPICVGQSATLTANGGGTYLWNTGATTQSITVSPGATTTYTVTVSTGPGCSATTTVSQVVNPLPTPSINPTTPICAGQSATLTANGGGTYAWNTGATTAAITVSPPSTTTYTVTVTNAAGCSATASATQTVNPLPTPSAGNNGPICAGLTLNLTSGGGNSYSWSGPGGFTSNTQNPTISNATVANSGIYTVTITSAAGCSITTTTNVTINPLPVPTANNNGPLCPTNTLNLSSSGGGTYQWIGPNGFNSTNQNPSIPNITVADAGTYTVTVTSAAGCTASTSTTVNIAPNLLVSAGSNSPICAGNTLNLTTSGGVSYSWTGPSGFTSIAQNPSITNVTTGNGGIYTVTVTDANGCSGTATVNVTVNPLPLPNAGNNGPICAGLTLNLNSSGGTGYNWSGPNGFTNNTQNPSIINATTTASGTYTVTVTDANGCSATATTSVTINALPTPTAGNNGPICQGTTLNLTSSGGTGYSWTGPNGFTNNTQNPSISNAPVAATGTYTVTVTSAAGCTATASTTAMVNPLPTPTAGNNGPICTGVTLDLNASGGTGYSWTGPNGFTNNTQNPSITNAPVAASGTYTVTVTSAAGCTATASTTVTVNPLPTPTAGNNGPICTGANLNLNASGGTGYSWSGPNGFTTNTQNPSITNAPVTASGTYTVTVTSAAGCTATASTTATVNPLPTPTAGNNGPICTGVTLDLNASGGTGYSWTGPNGFTNNTQNPSITNAPVAASGTYTVTVTSAAGCTATATTTVTVNPLPTPTAGNNGPICTGATLNLNASGGTGYSWTGPNGFANNTQNPSITNAPVAASGTYTVTITSAAGCTASATTTVTVNPLPTAIANNDGPVCEGNSFNLTSGGGVTYSWVGPGFYASNQQNNGITNAQPGQGGTYTVTVTDNNGCSSTASTTVVVNALPVAVANAGGPACEGQNISLSASGGINYVWAGPNAFSSNSQNPVISGANISNNGTYTVTVTDANGCSSTATTTITVFAIPTATFSAVNLTGCSPVCTDFTDLSSVNGSTISSWDWTYNGTSFSSQQNPTQCFTNVGLYDISLTVTSAQGCSATIIFNDLIQVYPNPIADFFINPDLIPFSNPVAQFVNTSAGNITSWNWNFGDGNTSTLENPNHSYGDTGVFCVTLTVVTANGCQASTVNCLYVYPEYSIYIPNTFTPNDDKLNDYFAVEGQGIKSVLMEIFNRWGEKIYTTDNLQGWPGFIRNSSEIAKQDVYSYKIYVTDILDGKHEYYGHVNLLR